MLINLASANRQYAQSCVESLSRLIAFLSSPRSKKKGETTRRNVCRMFFNPQVTSKSFCRQFQVFRDVLCSVGTYTLRGLLCYAIAYSLYVCILIRIIKLFSCILRSILILGWKVETIHQTGIGINILRKNDTWMDVVAKSFNLFLYI